MGSLPLFTDPTPAALDHRGACVHHKAGGKACGRGNDVERFRDAELRLPCLAIRGVRGTVPCDEIEFAPDVAAPAEPGPLTAMLALAEQGKCTTCGYQLTSTHEINGIVIGDCPGRHVQSAPRSRGHRR